MTLRRTFLTLVACTAWLAVAPFAVAETSATDFVKEKQKVLTGLVKAGKPDADVDRVFDGVLDYSALAAASLGDHWAERTEAERAEFTELLKKLVRNSYRNNLKKTLDYNVAYTNTEKGEAGEVVHTVASREGRKEEPLTIDYVVRVGGSPRIVDIVTEGSSMVANYRASFNRVMKKGGFPEVLKRMRKKAESGSVAAD